MGHAHYAPRYLHRFEEGSFEINIGWAEYGTGLWVSIDKDNENIENILVYSDIGFHEELASIMRSAVKNKTLEYALKNLKHCTIGIYDEGILNSLLLEGTIKI